MPKQPPAAGRVRKRSIVRVTAEKMAVVTAVRSTGRRSFKGLRQVDLYKVPSRSHGISRSVGYEEETVSRKSDGGMKRYASGKGGGNRRVIEGAGRNSSSIGDRGR